MFPGSFGFLLRPSSYSALASTYFLSWRHPIAKKTCFICFHYLPLEWSLQTPNFCMQKGLFCFSCGKVCCQFRNTVEALGFAKLTWITRDHLWSRTTCPAHKGHTKHELSAGGFKTVEIGIQTNKDPKRSFIQKWTFKKQISNNSTKTIPEPPIVSWLSLWKQGW